MFRPHTFNMTITVVGFNSQVSSSPLSFFPSGSDGKESACNAGDLGLIPGSGRSPGEGNGNPLQYSCLKKFHGQRSLAGYSPQGLKELDTPARTLSLVEYRL